MLFGIHDSEAIARLDNVGDYFTHTLSEHPLLQWDEIRKLVKRLPRRVIFYSAGVKPESAIIGDGDTYPGQHPLEHAIDNMQNANAYMFVIGLENDVEFRSIYLDLKVELDDFCRRNGHRLTESKLALFVSSPGAIAPHHLDHQHGFIAQIKGSKTVYQWPAHNFEMTTPEEHEIFFARVTRELALKDRCEHLRKAYEITPGVGAYIPFAAPHSVINGDEVSVSLSLIFNTRDTQKIDDIHRANYFLRNRCHLSPTLPGQSAWRDCLKNRYFRSYDACLRLAGVPRRAIMKMGRIMRGSESSPWG